MSDDRRIYEFGPFRLEVAAHTLYRDGVEIPLPPRLFDLLTLLVEARGKTVDKNQIMAAVWPDAFVEEGSLTRSISRLRSALGERGEEELIKTVARRGYRLVTPVVEAGVGAAADPSPNMPDDLPVDLPVAGGLPPTRRWRSLAVLGLALAAIAGLIFTLRTPPQAAPVASGPRSIAVLPFQAPNRDPSDEALGIGLADSLTTRLANQEGVAVRPTSAVLRFGGANVDTLAAGRALEVDAILEGTVRHANGLHRVSARLVDVRNGSQLWGHTFDESSADLLKVEDTLAKRLAGALSLALESSGRALHGNTANPMAYEDYLRGRFLSFKLTKESLASSRAHLDRAIALDPGFARAHAALAYLHVNTVDLVAPPREAFAAARAAVTRALALDPLLAEAHATLGLINWQYEWDWPAAEQEFRRAVDLEPSSAFVRAQYAFFLGSIGRAEESIAEGERARALDPLTPDFGFTNAMTFYWARRHGEALERISRVTNLDPGHWLASVILGRALAAQGERDRAIAVFERTVKLEGAMPEAMMDLGRAHAAAGHRNEAERALAELREFGRREHVSPFHLAVIHAALGEHDRAFEELDRAVEARSWYVTWLKVDPALDPLRSDPRFDRLLKRVGFTP